MVSNGTTFTLMHATASQGDVWLQGTNQVTKPSKNGLENLMAGDISGFTAGAGRAGGRIRDDDGVVAGAA